MEPRPATKVSVEALPGLPDHEVLQELGRGGMGVVYLATNKVMGRNEVLKVVNPQMLTEPGAMDRFLQEIRSAAQLSHPNIVTAHAVLRSGESLVLAMEHIVGENLHKVVSERGPLPVANACYYVHQVALGLQHAFDKGMVHRDIKPDNLMLTRDAKKHTVKILDFGLAKATRQTEEQQHNLTGAGKMMGTPDYIAPEQILDAAKADIRADIYSLGCTLYFLLTGSPPFKGGSLYEKLQAHMSTAPTSVHKVRKDVPLELAQIVDKMMAKDVKDRFQKPLEVAQALMPFVKGVKPLTALAGKIDSSGKSATLVPPETPKSTVDGAPKRTMVETNVPGLSKPHGKVKPRQIHTPAANGKKLLFIVGGLGVGIVSLLLLCVIGLWASGVFRLKTAEGILVVDVNEPNADVFVDGERLTVSWGKDGKQAEIRVKPGTLRVEVRKEGFTVEGKEIDFHDGDRRVFTATLTRATPIGANAEKNPSSAKKEQDDPPRVREGFIALFNGKDKTGWMTHPSQPGNWRVENGVLVGSGSSASHLYTQRADYKDFHLLAEARVNHRGNSGICFRTPFGPKVPPKAPQWLLGYEAQINSTHLDPFKTGSLYASGLGAVVKVLQSPVRPGDWFTMDVIAQGPHIVIKINGATTADYTDGNRLSTIGHIALQQHDAQTVAEFRRIEIREFAAELTPTPAPIQPPTQVPLPVETTPKEDPFVPLFNGKDTAGWKIPPGQAENWRVENGILAGPGKKASYLYSERADFKNFHLQVKARVNDGGNGGLYFRTPEVASKRPQGYKVLLNSSDLDLNKAGSLFNGFTTDLQNFRESLVLPGKWFTLDVIAVNNQIVVKIDGKQTAKYTDEKQTFGTGHIVLEQSDSQTAVDFEKIDIRELGLDAKIPLAVVDPAPKLNPGIGVNPNSVPGPTPAPGPGGGNKLILNVKGILRTTDPFDPTNQGKRFKVHPIQMSMGKSYVISLNSTAFDAYLRLQNPAGQTIAQDDDSGGNLNARIIHRCAATGLYRIIATSFNGRVGPYQLIVQESP